MKDEIKNKTVVMMATYNGSKGIIAQLESIRNQEVTPNYVVMRDDGSTDGTVEMVEEYIQTHQLSGWTIRRNEKNLGWRFNFRQLLMDGLATDANYFFFSDQDDEWYAFKMNRQLEVMASNESMQVLSGDYDVNVENYKYPRELDRSERISKYPREYNYVNHRHGWTFCMRRSLVALVSKHWKENYFLSHDNLFTSISGILETGYNLNESVGKHIRHENNASGHDYFSMRSSNERNLQELRMYIDFFDVVENVLSDLNRNDVTKVQDIKSFYQRRYKNAKEKKLLPILKQLVVDRRYYFGFTGMMRDIVFAFKK
ncbi:Glycosyltransferase, GT2 family [Pilibacter termitis]|uniref:Glycosyltransferase, GT2 family n=1 Tax=Pilibacter termitis TaxID=263852 RepID=A0A1T4P3Y6_9ENTE|nr:glycosyltransferase [Pilibacter termitis]SJZ86169.1 Glycosyltransferase, GT2 family [Pilibacter termitis]